MENELIMLITHCELELLQRNYQQVYSQWIKDEWSNLLQWATLNDYTTFDSDIANRYCKAIYGQNKLKDMEKFDKIIHRALRMLLSYQKEGDFEYRAPADIKLFIGQLGSQMETYLHQLRMSGLLTEGTLAIKRRYLQSFNTYLEEHRIALDDFNTDVLMNFYLNKNYSSISISNINPIIKSFLSWGYKNGLTAKDCSVFIMTNSYRKQRKLPTTYTEKEIKNMLVATDRNSPIGKRDYLILLLASEYGLRSSDIINFNFDQIDWDKNIITINQQKTGITVTYPLLSSVGNAIIDYLKHGRPHSTIPQIIIAHGSPNKGKKVSHGVITSAVIKSMKAANIKNWKKKKHGPHSLRHSLAVNLLKNNVSLPIISTILGHQNTESTTAYMSVDTNRLKLCCIPIPPLKTKIFDGV